MQPTLLVDKNIIERLATEEPKSECEAVLNALSGKYQLVFPWVLIEEVLINVGEPRNKDSQVIATMVDLLITRKGCWMEEETEMMFQELVIHGRTPKKLIGISDEAYEHVREFRKDMPGLQEFLTHREQQKHEWKRQRRELQDRIVPRGTFIKVKCEKDFVALIRRYYRSANPNEINAVGYLVDAARQLEARRKHRAYTKRIVRGFRSFWRSPERFFITTSCVIANMLYTYLPVYRIDDGTRDGRGILNRGSQRNNSEDQRYVACGLLCNRVLTGDGDMAKILRCLKEIALWRGDVIEVQPFPNRIANQLKALGSS